MQKGAALETSKAVPFYFSSEADPPIPGDQEIFLASVKSCFEHIEESQREFPV